MALCAWSCKCYFSIPKICWFFSNFDELQNKSSSLSNCQFWIDFQITFRESFERSKPICCHVDHVGLRVFVLLRHSTISWPPQDWDDIAIYLVIIVPLTTLFSSTVHFVSLGEILCDFSPILQTILFNKLGKLFTFLYDERLTYSLQPFFWLIMEQRNKNNATPDI